MTARMMLVRTTVGMGLDELEKKANVTLSLIEGGFFNLSSEQERRAKVSLILKSQELAGLKLKLLRKVDEKELLDDDKLLEKWWRHLVIKVMLLHVELLSTL